VRLSIKRAPRDHTAEPKAAETVSNFMPHDDIWRTDFAASFSHATVRIDPTSKDNSSVHTSRDLSLILPSYPVFRYNFLLHRVQKKRRKL
jgi:hypothetical protein